jgi:hypothetical protein
VATAQRQVSLPAGNGKNGLFVALYYKCIYVVWHCHCKWKFLNNKQAMKYFGQQYFVVVAAKCLQIISFLKKTR